MTPEEIVMLKKAGVGEDTIQLMIKEEAAGRRPKEPVPSPPEEKRGRIYEKDLGGGRRIKVLTTGRSADGGGQEMTEEEKLRRAWEILKNLLIDARGRSPAAH